MPEPPPPTYVQAAGSDDRDAVILSSYREVHAIFLKEMPTLYRIISVMGQRSVRAEGDAIYVRHVLNQCRGDTSVDFETRLGEGGESA